ncbi:hypothetical protein GPL21_19435 [Bradyrhizobium pachyrhizi]|uniref:Uncharacterized protein n=1 Tax=Bradyrhizobium pachyrhizi TaxID=280333 RepID=A0A844SMR2_9BRAD|nr:hypothetical protein [Bradyrhizobium pachyrhizi]MVT67277.1 hypothetical protein [Bradyrhizobium pachyrhizi]WFU53976.1 hypothetical protein QA639_30610 [Bradyrhizobium pachyrhizi]
MLAGQRHPKLLAPRGRGFTWLENQVFVHSVRSGLEQAEHDLAEPAARFAERNVGVITAGRPNAGTTGHRVRPSIPEQAVQHRCNRPRGARRGPLPPNPAHQFGRASHARLAVMSRIGVCRPKQSGLRSPVWKMRSEA